MERQAVEQCGIDGERIALAETKERLEISGADDGGGCCAIFAAFLLE